MKPGKNIQERLIIGVPLLLLFSSIFLVAPFFMFVLFLLALLSALTIEWGKLIGCSWQVITIGVLLVSLATMSAAVGKTPEALLTTLSIISVVILAFTLILLSRPKLLLELLGKKHLATLTALVFLLCVSYILTTWQFVDKRPLALLLSVIVVTDTSAFFFGKLLGKHKLSFISPNKTWEGLLLSLPCALLAIWIAAKLTHVDTSTPWLLLISGAGIWGAAILGDLFESACKRAYNVKDSGNILPGHGGLLDRMDSSIAVIPVLYLFIHSGLISYS